jgi:hypothetical protein
MNHIRTTLLAFITIGCMTGAGYAQTTTSPSTMAPTSSRAADDATKVETWTKKQWNAAKKEWEKDKVKWASCHKQSTKQKLAGRKSWSFLYSCMTK